MKKLFLLYATLAFFSLSLYAMEKGANNGVFASNNPYLQLNKKPEVGVFDCSKISGETPRKILKSIYDEALRGIDFIDMKRVGRSFGMSRQSFIEAALAYKYSNNKDFCADLQKKLKEIYPGIASQVCYRARPGFQQSIKWLFPVFTGVAIGTSWLSVSGWFNGERPLWCKFGLACATSAVAAWMGIEHLSKKIDGEYNGLVVGKQETLDWRLYWYLDEALKDLASGSLVTTGLWVNDDNTLARLGFEKHS